MKRLAVVALLIRIAIQAVYSQSPLSHFVKKHNVQLPVDFAEANAEWVDLNRDTLLDILIVGKSNNEVRLAALENKLSEFTFHDLGATGLTSASFTLADINYDGSMDVVLSGKTAGNLSVTQAFLNQDNFSFTKQANPLLSASGSLILLTDLDNDGRHDLILAGGETSQRFFRVYRKTNSGYEVAFDSTGIDVVSAEVADFSHTGGMQIFISGRDQSGQNINGLLGNDDGTGYKFLQMSSGPSGKTNKGDLNHDGWFDVIVSGRDELTGNPQTIFMRNAEGEFSRQDSISFEARELLIADFNSDGLADLYLLGVNEAGKRSSRFIYSDSTELALDTVRLASQKFGDHDRDGDLDFFQVIDSTAIKLIRIFDNEITPMNARSQPPTTGFAISTFNKTFIYWFPTSDDLTPLPAVTYDLWLARDDNERLLTPDFNLENNLHRTAVSHGKQGTSNFAVINSLTDDRYYYYVQAVDNAFNGSQPCTGGVKACFDLEREDLQACLGETVGLEMPQEAYWFSLANGFLGQAASMEFVASVNDTIFAFSPQLNDCSKNKAWAINVNGESVSENETVNFCEDQPVTLFIQPGWQQVEWRNKELLATAVDSLVVTLNQTDSITATASSGSCSYVKRFSLVENKPEISVANDYIKIIKGQTVQLSASGAVSYSWSPVFGLDQSNIANPAAAPLLTTTYTVTGLDSIGCAGTANVVVEVTETAFVPNLFTPNGDGKNDEVKIYGITNASTFNFVIYNREGSIVYQSQNLQEAAGVGWNGTHNGILQPNGLYYWKVEGEDNNGHPIRLNGNKSGSILLVR